MIFTRAKLRSGWYKEPGSTRAVDPLAAPRGVLPRVIPRPVFSRLSRDSNGYPLIVFLY